MIIAPVDTSRRIAALNDLTFQAAYLLEDQGWVQDKMTGDAGELCIVSAGHQAAHVIDIPGLSHVLREVLDYLNHSEAWNDTPGRSKTDVIGYLSTFRVTEEHLEGAFGPDWELVCYLAEFFGKMSGEEMIEWSEGQSDLDNYELLRHLDSQQEPDPRELRARGAICAAASEMAVGYRLNPMGASVGLMASKIIRPTLEP